MYIMQVIIIVTNSLGTSGLLVTDTLTIIIEYDLEKFPIWEKLSTFSWVHCVRFLLISLLGAWENKNMLNGLLHKQTFLMYIYLV